MLRTGKEEVNDIDLRRLLLRGGLTLEQRAVESSRLKLTPLLMAPHRGGLKYRGDGALSLAPQPLNQWHLLKDA